MQFSNCCKTKTLRVLVPALFLLPSLLAAASPSLTIAPPAGVSVRRGGTAQAKLNATLNPGFHANSHTPNEEYLIPLTLTWETGPLQAKDITYPKPSMEKYEFSQKPLSVVTGTFELTTLFTAPDNAQPGDGVMKGKLRYQACNENSCFPPKTVDVQVPYSVR